MNLDPIFKLEQVSQEFQTRQGIFTHGRTFSALRNVTLSFS